MAVDLADLVDSLRREVSPPGTDLFPNATDDEFLGYLQDAFWEARIAGMFIGYTVDDNGALTPVHGSTDLDRASQQAIVLYAGFRILLNEFRNLNASVRQKAGPVEQEIEKSAQLLKAVLDAIRERIAIVLVQLGTVNGTSAIVFDGVIERTYSTVVRDTWWVKA